MDQKPKSYRSWLSFDTTILLASLCLVFGIGGTALYDALRPTPPPAIAYLYPVRDGIPNVWLQTINDDRQDPVQLTITTMGVYDYDVSPDGYTLVYSTRDEQTLLRDMYSLNMRNGQVERLTYCGDENAECFAPAFHPSDPVLAYTQVASNLGTLDTRERTPRIWLHDLETNNERPLSPNPDDTGIGAVWSRDGNTLAYSTDTLDRTGVMVFRFANNDGATSQLNFVPNAHGSTGTLSPNGTALIIPEITNRDAQIFSYLKWVDFTITPPTFDNFTNPDDPVDDIFAEWHPQTDQVTIARRYTDERWTRGYQLIDVNIETGETTPILEDSAYSHHYFAWHPDGRSLVVQRLPLSSTGMINNQSIPEIWLQDTTTQTPMLVAEGAYLPHWVVRE